MTDATEPTWEEPLPLGWHTDLPPFPTDVLPPVLADYVAALSAELQTPADLTGPVVLGMVAASIAGRIRVRVRSGWEEPTNLYAVPVADPASRKSAVMAECRVPLDLAEVQLQAELADVVVDSRIKRKILDQRAEALQKKASATGDAAAIAEAQAAAREAEEVKVIAVPRLTTADATPEAVVGLLAEQGGRIAAISSEAGIFDSLTGRYGNKANLEPILMAHAGDAIVVDRRSRGPENIPRPALTLIASIQPYALREMVERPDFAGRGLLARVLWTLPPDLVGTRTWEATEVPGAVRAAYRALITKLAVEMAKREDTVTLELTEGAYKRLGDFYTDVERLLSPAGELSKGLCRPWGGKLVGAVVRVAGCLHAAGPDASAGEIKEHTIVSAIALGEYFRKHATAALSPADDERTVDSREVLGVLIAKGMESFTVRELHRRVPRRLQKSEYLVTLLTYLDGLGFVRARISGGYQLHPAAAKYLTSADSADSADTSDVCAGQVARDAPSTTVSTPADSADSQALVSAVSAPPLTGQHVRDQRKDPLSAVSAATRRSATR